MALQHNNIKSNGVNNSPKSTNSQNDIGVKEIDRGNLIEQNFLSGSNTENGKEIYNVENDPLGKILASFGLEVTEEDKNKISKISSIERSISTDSSIYIKALIDDNNENYRDKETDTFIKPSSSVSTNSWPVKKRAKSKKGADSCIITKGKLKNNCEDILNTPHLQTVNSVANESTINKTPKRKTRRKKVQKESVTSVEEQRIKVIEGTPCQRTRSKKTLVQVTL